MVSFSFTPPPLSPSRLMLFMDSPQPQKKSYFIFFFFYFHFHWSSHLSLFFLLLFTSSLTGFDSSNTPKQLVEEVFKDEVDQFVIESGVQGLCIRQKSEIWRRSRLSTSLTWTSAIFVPSLGLVLTDSANQRNRSSDGQSRGHEKHSISQDTGIIIQWWEQFPILPLLFPFQVNLKHLKVNKQFLI